MALFKKIWAFVNQDVADESESKKNSVLMRVFILILLLYLPVQGIFLLSCEAYLPMTVSIVTFLCYMMAYLGTYKGKTNQVLIAIQVITIVWIILSVWMLGWDSGAQQFMLILLTLALFSNHQRVVIKVVIALAYLGIRMTLYLYSLNAVAMFPMTRRETMMLQTINSVAIYVEIAFLSFLFAKEAHEAEEKLVSYNKKIKEMAFQDQLTKLRNRRSMLELLQESIQKDNKYFCIAIADIDFFKKINDSYGHEAGDEVLKKVADILNTFVSKHGYVARWGGEEFLFLLHHGNGDDVKEMLDTLRMKIEQLTVPYEEKEIRITMTFGMVEYNKTKSLEENISLADQKLYFGKESGRNKVVF